MGTLTDRVRVERPSSLVAAEVVVEFEDGVDILFEDGTPINWSTAAAGDGAGNVESDFVRIGPAKPLRCDIRELNTGDEVVIAAKLQGVAPCLVTLRVSDFVRQLTPADRFVELLPGGGQRVLNIRTTPPPARDARLVTFLCESGVAT